MGELNRIKHRRRPKKFNNIELTSKKKKKERKQYNDLSPPARYNYFKPSSSRARKLERNEL